VIVPDPCQKTHLKKFFENFLNGSFAQIGFLKQCQRHRHRRFPSSKLFSKMSRLFPVSGSAAYVGITLSTRVSPRGSTSSIRAGKMKLFKRWLLAERILPGPPDALQPRSRPVAHIDEIEYAHQCRIPGLRIAACYCDILVHEQVAWIADGQLMRFQPYKYGARAAVVAMDDCVCQGFIDGLIQRIGCAMGRAVHIGSEGES
jgi:hypothetical protein